MQYDDTNSGMMSRNDNKQSEKQPDFKGFVNVEGREYWLSAWVKEAGPNAKNPGRKFFSIALTPKEQHQDAQEQQQAARENATGGKSGGGFDEDIPWNRIRDEYCI